MKKISIQFLIAILFCQLSFPLLASAQKQPSQNKDIYAEKLRGFEDFVNRQMQRDRIPGMTIGFTKDNYTWVKGFGYADLENKVPAKPESSYQTASILKPMTAVAILQLVEKGKINLDAEVQTYVPYFPKKKFSITIRQLLGHLGGISHYKTPQEKFIKEPKTTKETIALFANNDLVAEPGTKFNYSTYGYDLLGAVIEEVSGQSYADYMREHVWKPLEMNDTRLDSPIEFIPNRVRGYQYFDNGEKDAVFGELRNAEYIDLSHKFAAGGARTTAIDMLKFRSALNAGKLISKESLNLTQMIPVTRDGRISGFGILGYTMGGVLLQHNGRFGIHYDGGQQGTSTLIENFPAENLTISIAANVQTRRIFIYLQKLFSLIMKEPYTASAYMGDKISGDQFAAMKSVFEGGLSYFDIHQKPLATSQTEVSDAFAYFNKYANRDFLASNRDEALKKISDGQQPFAGQAFTRLGSFMAQKLSEKYGASKIPALHASGAIPFFNDYILMYKTEPAYPKEFQFDEDFEKALARWESDWRKTNTEYVRALTITPETDFDAVGRELKKTFAGAKIYPDLGLNAYVTGSIGSNFFNVAKQLLLQGDAKKATLAAQLAVELYPESDLSNTALAVVNIFIGEKDKAQMLLRKALTLNADGSASAGSLNTLAYDFASAGKLDFGLELLITAAEMYPQNANIYDSLGEFYMRRGEKQQAIKSYKRALEINPSSAKAKQMLEKLTVR
jgi:CubicO group peptidase (beta-lactamase class C family)/predicted negative regulator of RcsB-dependent stress response